MSSARTSGLRSREGSAHSRFRFAPTALVRRWPRHTPADRNKWLNTDVKVQQRTTLFPDKALPGEGQYAGFWHLGILVPGDSAHPSVRVQDVDDTVPGLRCRPMQAQGIVSSAASRLTLVFLNTVIIKPLSRDWHRLTVGVGAGHDVEHRLPQHLL